MGMFALNAVGQIGQHQAQKSAVKQRNRARLRNFDAANQNYLNEVKLDNAEWKNNVQVQEIEQDKVYQAMVDQWSQQDAQLDKLFAESDFELQDRLVKMYETSYAGTQTGATAGRLAGKSAKKFGMEKAKLLSNMMLARKEVDINKNIIRNKSSSDSNALFEKIRFSPIHGHTPLAPELEAKPSSAGLILGLATSALSSYGMSKVLKATDVTKAGGSDFNPNTNWGDFSSATESAYSATPLNDITSQPLLDFNTGVMGDWNIPSTYQSAQSMTYGKSTLWNQA